MSQYFKRIFKFFLHLGSCILLKTQNRCLPFSCHAACHVLSELVSLILGSHVCQSPSMVPRTVERGWSARQTSCSLYYWVSCSVRQRLQVGKIKSNKPLWFQLPFTSCFSFYISAGSFIYISLCVSVFCWFFMFSFTFTVGTDIMGCDEEMEWTL